MLKKKIKNEYTGKAVVLGYLVWCPILSFLMALGAFALFAFLEIFIGLSIVIFENISLDTLFGIVLILSAILVAKWYTKAEGKKGENARLLTLLFPLINSLVILIVYALSDMNGAFVAALILNPINVPMMLVVSLLGRIDAVMMALIVPIVHSIVIFTVVYGRDALKFSAFGKRVFCGITTAVLVLNAVFGIFAAYPELYYINLQKKYGRLDIANLEIDDYAVYDYLPFGLNEDYYNAKELPVIQSPELVYEDMNVTPRMDGATAFYPVAVEIGG